MEGLERLRAKFTIDLHPSKLASAAEGVRAHLSSLLLRYNEDLEGVLLSFQNERVLTHAATIHPYFAFVRLDVAADVVLFRPRPGMRLVGTVNKVGADYVGLLVLGFLNAAIAADHIRPEFRPRLAEQCWASSKAGGHRLEVGSKVHFDVAGVRHHGAFVSIAGSLQQPTTGAEGFAKAPKRPGGGAAAAAAPLGAGSAKQQRQRQQQQQQQQAGAGKKEKKKKRQREEAGSTEPQPQQQQQQGAVAAAVAPQEAAPAKNAKKAKQQQQQQQALAAAAVAAAPAAAAAGSNKKPKGGKKRKAEDGPPAAAPAAANGSAEQHHKKKKKKQKHKDEV